MKLYLGGPMRGYEELNFPAFNRMTARLRDDGFDVLSPVEINPDPNANYIDCMREDIRAITECDGIFLLKGWENSEGANAEYQVARMLKLEVMFEVTYNNDKRIDTAGTD